MADMTADYPDDFWIVEATSGTWWVTQDVADTLWDAMRQGHPSCLEFQNLYGVTIRLVVSQIQELSQRSLSAYRASRLHAIAIDEEHAAIEQEVKHLKPWSDRDG